MFRVIFTKLMWVGKATTFLVGLAVIVGLTAGLTSTALAANGQPFLLGKLTNVATAVTRLSGNLPGPALQIINSNPAANATALNLATRANKPPMKVNSATKVANLNSDQLDGQDSSAFLPINGTAANATNAANADKLDGKDSSELAGALAYAHVNANGTLDVSRSKNARAITKPTSSLGHYCIDFTVTPRNVVATLETDPGVPNGGTITEHTAGSGLGSAECSDGTNIYNVQVLTRDLAGAHKDMTFDIVVN